MISYYPLINFAKNPVSGINPLNVSLLDLQGGKIHSLGFHRTDDLLVTSSEDDSLRLFDIANAKSVLPPFLGFLLIPSSSRETSLLLESIKQTFGLTD